MRMNRRRWICVWFCDIIRMLGNLFFSGTGNAAVGYKTHLQAEPRGLTLRRNTVGPEGMTDPCVRRLKFHDPLEKRRVRWKYGI